MGVVEGCCIQDCQVINDNDEFYLKMNLLLPTAKKRWKTQTVVLQCYEVFVEFIQGRLHQCQLNSTFSFIGYRQWTQ